MMAQVVAGAPVRRVRTPIDILGLLDWAFRVECAQMVFDQIDDAQPCGFGMEYIMIEQARLGCRVDGGGSSPCHPDADLVADAVAQLPEGCGGRQMAVIVAEHARAGSCPDWGQAAPPLACEPVEWKRCKHGEYAARVFWTGRGRWPSTWLGRDDGYACAVTYTGTAREIAARRRNYLQWRMALLHLLSTFKTHDNLSSWEVMPGLPPCAPWKDGAKRA